MSKIEQLEPRITDNRSRHDLRNSHTVFVIRLVAPGARRPAVSGQAVSNEERAESLTEKGESDE